MGKLKYYIGDALQPVCKPAIICHCCNDEGGWGRGFVLALRDKYPTTESQYRAWYKTGTLKLGKVQFVQVSPEIRVANMIGQHGTQWAGKIPPIRYGALETGFKEVYALAAQDNLTVHMPRIGAVLAGGEWLKIEEIIMRTMTVDTYVYTLEAQKGRWPTIYEN